MQSLLLFYATKLRLFNYVFPTKLYFTPKVNYGTLHFVKFSSSKKYQKSKIFTIFYNVKLDKIVPTFSYLRKISFGGKTKVSQLGTIYPQRDTEHLTTLLTSKNFTIMEKWILLRQTFYEDERGIDRACPVSAEDIIIFNTKKDAIEYAALFKGYKKIDKERYVKHYEAENHKFRNIITITKRSVL